MRSLQYDLAALVGIASITAGIALNFGAGWALIAAGSLTLGLLLFIAMITRGKR